MRRPRARYAGRSATSPRGSALPTAAVRAGSLVAPGCDQAERSTLPVSAMITRRLEHEAITCRSWTAAVRGLFYQTFTAHHRCRRGTSNRTGLNGPTEAKKRAAAAQNPIAGSLIRTSDGHTTSISQAVRIDEPVTQILAGMRLRFFRVEPRCIFGTCSSTSR